jgi:antagonist of KipI
MVRYIPVGEPWQGVLTASLETSRIGMRLLGFDQVREPLVRSEPSVFGAIQAAPGGELLIHGPEGPVTGGYPKIGCVIRADLGRAAQIRPGDAVRLVPTGVEEARRALRIHERTQPALEGVDWIESG